MNEVNINSLALAYIGDGVYELKVREFLINKNILDVNELQKEATKYVSASSQALILDRLLDNNILTSKEYDIVMRARNHKVRSKPKHVSIIAYKKATALEALLGYLYLCQDEERINIIISNILRGE